MLKEGIRYFRLCNESTAEICPSSTGEFSGW
jgi:hypothetical protein